MSKRSTRALAAILPLLAVAPTAAAQNAPIPVPQYTVTLKQVQFNNGVTVPALQSFARAVGSNGQWLIVTGRTNGLHTFPTSVNGAPPANAFPPAQANTRFWVIDVVQQKVWSAPVPIGAIGDSLSVTNAEYAQSGDTLYVFGGYGQQASTGQMMTFPTITAIPVDETIAAVIAGTPLPVGIQQINTWYDCTIAAAPLVCNAAILSGSAALAEPYLSSTGPYYAGVAGGGMEMIGPIYWMVFGQNFQGLYSADPGDMGNFPKQQIYMQQLAGLWIGTIGGNLAAAVMNVVQADPNPSGNPPTAQWHRRDLNVVPGIDENGDAMLSAYGGVFIPGQIAAFQQPIHITATTIDIPGTKVSIPLEVSTTLDPYLQLFSQYECATMKLYSASAGTNQTVFFGGIGLYYINMHNTLQMDTGLPFVNTLSVLATQGTRVLGEVYASTPLPAFIGANATFIPNPAVPRQTGEIIALDKITTSTLAGWLYGGILSTQTQTPQGQETTQATQASNAIYEVWLTPGAPPSNFWNSASPEQTSVQKTTR